MHSYVNQTRENKGKSKTNTPVRSRKNDQSIDSFNDNRPETLQLKKIQELAHSNPAAPNTIQFERPKPLSEMLAERASSDTDHGRETKNELDQKVDLDTVSLNLYQKARDHDLGTGKIPLGFNQNQIDSIPTLVELIHQAISEAQQFGNNVEADEASIFGQRFPKMIRGTDAVSQIGKYYYVKT
jgi:hypothetical protein